LLTLIRHGQAGSRLVYDDLSKTGCEQSRALGAWFRERETCFDLIVAGGLTRQRITAQEIISAMGSAKPDLEIDSRWSEFDLDQVYAGIGPLLAREDERFGLAYEQLQREVGDPESSAHRSWRNCDVTVVRAWIEARYEFAGESFSAFGERVREALFSSPRDRRVAVVTSATPIALCAAAALDLSPRRVMQLAGALRNTAFSEMDLRPGDPRLVSFNNVPHLREERLRTVR
jgi:broad specificity phosphatase PhoE